MAGGSVRYVLSSYTVDGVIRSRDSASFDNIREAAAWARLAFESGADKVQILDQERGSLRGMRRDGSVIG